MTGTCRLAPGRVRSDKATGNEWQRRILVWLTLPEYPVLGTNHGQRVSCSRHFPLPLKHVLASLVREALPPAFVLHPSLAFAI